ncbi:hypothetical protein [Francisella halioticida]|uniref:hypothetical protein n=1 Tax=Francisella halioticida TaxID=549298 RepID=UPI0012FAA8EC|nr:hypothetical protein [Francisella halioticida]
MSQIEGYDHFFILVVAIPLTAENGIVSSWWINLSYLFEALGELFIGPIGLAMVSIVSPQEDGWFFYGSVGFKLSIC